MSKDYFIRCVWGEYCTVEDAAPTLNQAWKKLLPYTRAIFLKLAGVKPAPFIDDLNKFPSQDRYLIRRYLRECGLVDRHQRYHREVKQHVSIT